MVYHPCSAAEVVAWGANYASQTNVPAGLSNVVALAGGFQHSLALRADGTVVAWGDDGTHVPAGLSNVVAVVGGGDHSDALLADGTVAAWGYGGEVPAGLSNVVAAAGGYLHALTLFADGTVAAWGDNGHGQTSVPAGLSNVVAVAAGLYHSLALRADGTVAAWGYNNYGQTNVPVGLSNVVAVAGGESHSLALRADGTVAAWGANYLGQTNMPVGLSRVVAVAAGAGHSLALRDDGTVAAWGRNDFGQRTVPAGLSNVVAVAAGEYHSLALRGLPRGVAAPQIVGPRSLIGTVDRPFYYRILAKNIPNHYSASGLPPGLAVAPVSGLITGRPTQSGTYSVVLGASNALGAGECTVTLVVNLPLPGVLPDALVPAVLGSGFSYRFVTINAPEWLGVSGLPAGLAIDPTTGVISGTPLELGDFPVSVMASNRYGMGSGSLTIRVSCVAAWGQNWYGQTNVPAGLSNVVAVAAGMYHSLALRADGTVAAWGYNGSGQTNVPVVLSNVVAVAAGLYHSLALRVDGTVAAWGDNGSGQRNVPAGLSNAVAVAGGASHSLALRADGTVAAWGDNGSGQTTVPAGLNNVVAVACGAGHNLALRVDGTVTAWGDNGSGQTNVPAGLSNVVAVAGGASHSLALRADGTVVTWGDNRYGQRTVPVGLSNVVAVAGGVYHSLALRADGTVAAWGDNSFGQCAVPVGLNNVVAVAGGGYHSLALGGLPGGVTTPQLVSPRFLVGTVDRAFYYRILAKNVPTSYSASGLPAGLVLDPASGLIMGRPTQAGTYSVVLGASNALGMGQWTVTLVVNLPLPYVLGELVPAVLGNGFSHQVAGFNAEWLGVSELPAGLAIDPSSGLISGTPLELGDFRVSVLATNRYGTASGALTIRVLCVAAWGLNSSGQTTVPVGLSNVVMVAAGNDHSMALRADGTVAVWGDNWYGQTNVPVGLRNVVAVTGGGEHSLALRVDGTVAAWGRNDSGQATVPAGLINVVAVAGGASHSMALRADGTVAAWGYNGTGQTTVPAGLSNVVAVACGGGHNLALRANGTVAAWGDNRNGKTTVPVGLSNVVMVAAGNDHSMALRADGTVAVWGDNWYGQTNVPVGLRNVVAVTGGDEHSLALRADGTVAAWGYNGSGQTNVPAGLSNLVAVAGGWNHSLGLVPSPNQVCRSRVVRPGGDYFLTVPLGAGQAAQVQWYHDGVFVQSGSTLWLTNFQPADLGQYVAVSQLQFCRFTNAVIQLRFSPDLQVVSLDTPLEALGGSSQPVSWTVVNAGHAPATGTWVDRVYLSTDPVAGNDRLLGEFPASRPFGTNESLTRLESILLPADLEPDHDYWWVVVTDAGNTLEEEDVRNNTCVSDTPMRLLRAALPNLRVASVDVSASRMSGQPVTISWAVSNAGSWSTGASLWQDAVYLSATTNVDGTAFLLGRTQRPRPLGTNEGYASSLTATLPQGLSGIRYFIVQTDADNRVNEGPFENDNTTASAPVAIALTPPPDLQVAAIQGPTNAVSGASLAVSWTVTNAGPGVTAEASWYDDVYLSATSLLGTNAQLLGSFPHGGVLTNGQSYNSVASIAVPSSLSGTFYLLVQTDSRSNVFEDVFETNNVSASASPILIALTPPPDLAVCQVSTPAKALASHSLVVSYAVTNRGPTAASGAFWEDRLYITTNPPPHPFPLAQGAEGVLWLASDWRFGGLGIGEAYTNTFAALLPDGLNGAWYGVVETDSGGQVFELIKTNNTRASELPIQIESHPADLVVATLAAPSSGQAGGSLLVSWSVKNQGSGDSVVSQWSDRLVLSADGVAGNTDDVTLLTRDHNGLLAAGGSYAVSNQVAIVPFAVSPGNYQLFLITDSGNAVFEGANEANNASSPHAIAITRQAADLSVTAVAAPTNALSEDTITVSWKVENSGVAAPNSTAWSDAIYLSTNVVWDTNALLLATQQNPASLVPGTFYTNALDVTLPAEIQGDFFVHVVTDSAGEVIEASEANNTLAAINTLHVTLRPVPDLAVVSVTTPTDGFSGQLFELSWTVTNRGSASAEGTWYDSVYLSLDPQFEPSLDDYIGYAERPHALTNGQSYTQTTQLQIPPDVSGLFHVFVVCDATGRVNERGATTNNVGRAATPVSVWLQPPSDLVVGTITIATNAVSGYDMALTYVLRNQGTNAAFGPWADALYLSADDQWDIGDTLFTRVNQNGFLAAAGSRTNTVNAPAPGVLPGNYHVIIRTDIVNQVPETNELNNLTGSLDQTATEVQELTLGVAATNQLTIRQARYYRVHVTAGQVLFVELDCASPVASTELYVRYAAIPTRSEFDFIHSNPLQPNHRIVVPSTLEGDYYILAYGDFIPAPGSTAITLTARLSQFLVLDTFFGQGGNAGNLTIPVSGASFDRTCTVRLTSVAGLDRPALSHYYESSTRFYATLGLQGLAPGFYTVVIQNGDGLVWTVPNSVEVVATAGLPRVVPVVSAPRAVRDYATYQFTVQWANTGLNDAPAPLLTVGNTYPFGLAPGDYSLGTRYTFLGINAQGGPRGILRPGQTEMLTFHSKAGGVGAHEAITAFADRALKGVNVIYDWDSLRRQLSTGELPAAEFDRAFAQVISQIGPTQGDFLAMLARNCSLVPASLGDPRDPDTALQIEWNRAIAATGTSISGQIFAPDARVQFTSVSVSARNTLSGASTFAPALLDGTFTFPRLAPGVYELSATGAVLNGGQPVVVGVNVGQAVTNLFLDAAVGATVHGLVYDAATGQAISGAALTLLGTTNAAAVTASTVDGGFAFAGISSGTYSLVAEAPGKARKTIQNLAVPLNGDLAVNIPLSGEARISGTVTDQSGSPIPSFAVSLYASYTNSGNRSSIPGLAGAFSGTEIEPGIYDMAVFASGYVVQWTSNLTLTAGATVQMGPVALSPAGTITGRVIDLRGGGDTAAMMGAFQNNELVAGAFIADDGSYIISGLAPGTYLLKTLLPPGGGVVAETQVTVSAGQTNAIKDTTVFSGATVEGYVSISSTGGPAEGIGVRLLQGNGTTAYAITATNGQFTFPGLAAGTYRVGLDPAGMFANQTLQVTNVDHGTNRADFILDALARLEGTVRLATGAPVAGASVALKAGTNYVASAITDGAGGYRFLLMTTGAFYLQANSLVGSFAPVGPIAVSVGDALQQDIVAGTGRMEIGPVLAYGTNAPAGYLNLSTDLGESTRSATFESGQVVVLTNLAAGYYRLTVRSGSSLGGVSPQEMLAGQTYSFQPSVSNQLQLQGAVTDAGTGLPVGGAIVMVVPADGAMVRASLTETNGAYTLPYLERGQYDLVAYGAGYTRSLTQGLYLSQDARTNLVLHPAAAILQGRVIGPTGLPVAGAIASALDAGNVPFGASAVDVDGRFTIPVFTNSVIRMTIAAEGFDQTDFSTNITSLGNTTLPELVLQPRCIATQIPGSLVPSLEARLAQTTESAQYAGRYQPKDASTGVRSWLFSFFDFFSKPPTSDEHTEKSDAPPDQCHLKKCSTKWRDTNLAVEKQNETYQDALGVGRKVVGTRGLWVSDALVLWAKSSVATILFVHAAIEVAGYESALTISGTGSATIDFLLTEVRLAAAKWLEDCFAVQLKAGLIQSSVSPQDAVAKSSAVAAEAFETARSTVTVLNKLDKLTVALSTELPSNPWTVFKRNEELRKANFLFTAVNYAGKLVSDARLAYEELTGFAQELVDAEEEYKLKVEAYNRAAHEARGYFFRYQGCLAQKCNPCEEQNTAPACDPCKGPNRPDYCKDTEQLYSWDPNDIVGPGGFGPEYWISPDQTFHYTVRFENDAQKATAPAQYVRVTQQLSTNLDFRTFRLGAMAFGTNLVDVPAERTFYQTRLNVTNTLGVLVDIAASLDLAKGEVTWEFSSIDPQTGSQPLDPFLGFLPPNTNGIIGQGFVSYTIKPKAGLGSGDIINAEARIYFDYNEPMDTPHIFNTVDTGLPTSTVLPLPLTTNRNIFPVRWAGTDTYGGAGIGGFDIYVSDNSGPWKPWLQNTPYWEQLFVGEYGHTYAFYSVARDNVGNREVAVAAAQAQVHVLSDTPPVLAAAIQSPGQIALTLYGTIGAAYAIESATALGGGTNWQVLAPNILLTNQSQVLTLPTGGAPATFYRARVN